MYTWGYIKDASLAKLDLNEMSATQQELINRFYIYANEVITQVCSAIKPKYSFQKFEITEDMVGEEQVMPNDFVTFGDDVNYQIVKRCNETFRIELHDEDFTYHGYNHLIFFHTGTFYISYYARWYTFDVSISQDTEIDVPNDILDCIPSYIASQCYKIDDEYKAQVYRNEYEMLLGRINDTNYKNTKTFTIEGGW